MSSSSHPFTPLFSRYLILSVLVFVLLFCQQANAYKDSVEESSNVIGSICYYTLAVSILCGYCAFYACLFVSFYIMAFMVVSE